VVVIPFLDEEAVLCANITRYQSIRDFHHPICETAIIFVDGGSHDRSAQILKDNGFEVVNSQKGRAKQQNTGADYFNGEYDAILFLHVDTFFLQSFFEAVKHILDSEWGFFKLCLSNTGFMYRVVSAGINFRSWLLKRGTGDQALFFSREMYTRLNGFSDLSLMEDVDVCTRAKKICLPKIGSETVQTSARRWEENGVFRTVISMWFFQICFLLGVNSKKIERWYYSNKR